MAFKATLTSPTECLITLENADKALESFTPCVEEALKSRRVKITIDLTVAPETLKMILSPLLKVTTVVGAHQGFVAIKGIDKAFQDFLPKLEALGVKIVSGAASAAPLESTDFETGLSKDRQQILEFLKTKNALEKERNSYQARIKKLSERHNAEPVSQDLIQKIADLETGLENLKETKISLQQKLAELIAKKTEIEAESKKALADAQKELGDKKKPVEKKLADLVKSKEKLVADLKKKQEAKKAPK